MATIYIQLLNEGVDVWRPVDATHLADDRYRIEGDVPDGEDWQFQPGTVVRCDWMTFSDGERGLTATSVAN